MRAPASVPPFSPTVRYGVLAKLVNATIITAFLWTPLWMSGAEAAQVTLAAFGDSLSAGLGLPAEQAFPAVLERALRDQGLDVRVVNAGVSGDTTAGGKARLDWVLGDRPQAAIVELGANDALRGIDPKDTEANLDAILGGLKGHGVRVLLAGMRAPPNLGADYAQAFEPVYPRLAAKHGVALYPFFLDGVAADPGLNQPDGMHPNAEGVRRIAAAMLPAVRALLKGATP
jgi:acyl-CoA thioesterase-1